MDNKILDKSAQANNRHLVVIQDKIFIRMKMVVKHKI